MEPIVLSQLAEELSSRARQEEHAGRAAQNLLSGQWHPLSQTVIALLAGHELAEHDSPGEATLQVLSGRVRFAAASGGCDLVAGELLPIPRERHAVAAAVDSVLLLTVVKDSRSAHP